MGCTALHEQEVLVIMFESMDESMKFWSLYGNLGSASSRVVCFCLRGFEQCQYLLQIRLDVCSCLENKNPLICDHQH